MLTHIRNARVYAPANLGIRDLVVGGGRVLSVAEASDAIPGAETIDFEGRRLLPGLIDSHAHLTGGGGEAGFRTRVPPVPLGQFTRAGITSVVGVLGTDDVARDTRSLVAATYALREQGLGAWCHTGGYHYPLTTLTGSARDDIVFVDPIIGVGEFAISDHRSSQPSLNELLRVASDAHVAGMIAAKAGILHLHLGDGERGLDLVRQALTASEIPARVFNPTHANRRKALFDEAIDIARQGCTIDITAFPVAEDEDAWSAEVALARYLESGAPATNVTISSDGGGCLPEFDEQGKMQRMDIGSPANLADTLKTLLDRDFALEDVLPAFTANVADLLLLRDRGTITANARADLISLDDEHRICDVMIGGTWHMRDGESLVLGDFERSTS